MSKKKLASALIFLVIFCMIFLSVEELLKPKWGIGTGGARETLNANGFYDEPKNSLDVMFFGSSHCFFSVSPMKMWENHGFTSYVRGSANQSIFLTYYTLKESLKYQTPEVVVIEVGQMYFEFDPTVDEWIARRGLDYLKPSDVKTEAILDLELEGSQQTYMGYFFPLLRYHSRWKELGLYDFDYYNWEAHNSTRGQYTGVSIYPYQWPEGFMEPDGEICDIPAQNVEYMDRIAALCEENDIELVLLKAPMGDEFDIAIGMVKSPMEGWSYTKHANVQALADRYGVTFMDYNLAENIEAIGLDPATDFHYNQWHLRITGADKMSTHLGNFLAETFDLPDHRGDAAYAIWDEDLEEYNELKRASGLA